MMKQNNAEYFDASIIINCNFKVCSDNVHVVLLILIYTLFLAHVLRLEP